MALMGDDRVAIKEKRNLKKYFFIVKITL